MPVNASATVFVYQHRETGEARALYLDDAWAMQGRTDYEHVATLEPRAWIESAWSELEESAEIKRQRDDLLSALQDLITVTQHLDVCPGTLEAAQAAVNNATRSMK